MEQPRFHYIPLVLLCGGLLWGENCQITSPLPVPVSISGCTFSSILPGNSTSYIQNTLAPTTTTQMFSVQTASTTGSLTDVALAGAGTQCVQVNNTGLFQGTGAACGSGGGGGGTSLGVGYGTSSGYKVRSSSFTSDLIFDQSIFLTSLQGASTVFMTITYSTNAVTGNYTTTSTDTYVSANCSSACTVTLSTNVSSGKVFMVAQAGTGNVTVQGASGNISGGNTALINQQFSELDVIWDGSNFFVK